MEIGGFFFFKPSNGLSEHSVEIKPMWFRVTFNRSHTLTFIFAASYNRYLAVARNFNSWILSLGSAVLLCDITTLFLCLTFSISEMKLMMLTSFVSALNAFSAMNLSRRVTNSKLQGELYVKELCLILQSKVQ